MRATTLILLGGLAAHASFAQGTFQNLGFESANVGPSVTPRTVTFASAFPGWIGYYNGGQPLNVSYNTINIGTSGYGILDTNAFSGTFPVFNGQYTAVLQGGTPDFDTDVGLGQTGLIPLGTLSLRFLGFSGRDNFVVTLGGQRLAITTLQDFGTYREYGANIPGLAGQVAELRFTQPHGPGLNDNFFLDAVSFSPVAVPEPSTWALLTLGSALFWCAARRRKI